MPTTCQTGPGHEDTVGKKSKSLPSWNSGELFRSSLSLGGLNGVMHLVKCRGGGGQRSIFSSLKQEKAQLKFAFCHSLFSFPLSYSYLGCQ